MRGYELKSTFAFLDQALQMDARNKSSYALRLILLLFILIALLFAANGPKEAAGLHFFKAVSYINFFFITLTAANMFSSSITEEKEENNLGLLLMTGISPFALLFGKCVSRLVWAALFLVIQLPFTVLATTLGGVDLLQIGAVYFSLAAYLFFIANFAMFFSVISATNEMARNRFSVALVLYFALPPLFYFIIQGINNQVTTLFGRIGEVFYETSYFKELGNILSTTFAGPLIGFQFYSNLGMGIGLFLISCLLFHRFSFQEKPTHVGGFRDKLKFKWLDLGRGPIWKNCIAWKEFYFFAGGRNTLARRALFYLGIFLLSFIWAFWWKNEGTVQIFGPLILTCGTIAFILKLGFLMNGVTHEIHDKTWSTLALTPISVGSIFRQKLLGSLAGVSVDFCAVILGIFLVNDWPGMELFWGYLIGFSILICFLYYHLQLSLALGKIAGFVAFFTYPIFLWIMVLFEVIILRSFVRSYDDSTLGIMLMLTFLTPLLISVILHRCIVATLKAKISG